MNAITTYSPSLVPASMSEAMKLAEMMASAKLVPQGLQKSPADCLMVIQQAVRWQMDPFAVAQECSVIQGKLMHSGKLVAAVVNARGNLTDRLSFAYSGENGGRTITVSGRLHGETEPRSVSVRLSDAKTNNRVWQSQPDQQLMYHGVRVWARRHTPELMLGVWSPEEFDETANGNGPVINLQPEKPAKRTMAEISANKARKTKDHDDVIQELADVGSLPALEQYQRERLTPEFMAGLGGGQWLVEEALEKRRAELSAPIDDEPDDGLPYMAATEDPAVEYLRDELVIRIEGCETKEDLMRLRDSADFRSALARLPAPMILTVRRHGAAMLEKLPAGAM